MRLRFLFAFCLAAFIPHSAFAACQPVLNISGSSSALVDYDPFQGTNTFINIPYRLSNEGETACKLRISLISEDNSSKLRGAGGNLNFSLVNNSNWNISRQGPALATIDIELAAEETGIGKTVSLFIPEGQVVSPGSYTQGLRFLVKDKSSGVQYSESNTADITAQVQPRVDAVLSFAPRAFGGTGSVTVFDLGTLHSGLTDTLYLQLRTNSAASIQVSSQNGGRLLHKQDPALKPINYDLSVDNKSAGLSAPFTVMAKAPPTLQGRAVPLTFHVGQVSGHMSGIYSDTINIIVTAY